MKDVVAREFVSSPKTESSKDFPQDLLTYNRHRESPSRTEAGGWKRISLAVRIWQQGSQDITEAPI